MTLHSTYNTTGATRPPPRGPGTNGGHSSASHTSFSTMRGLRADRGDAIYQSAADREAAARAVLLREAEVRGGALRRWEDWAMLLAGVGIALTPWIFGYNGLELAMMNAVFVGLLMAALAALALTLLDHWEGYVNLGLGFWLAASPWLLGYSLFAAATWTHFGFGLLIAGFSALDIWRGVEEDEED